MVNQRRGTSQYQRNRARVRAVSTHCHICGDVIDKSLKWPDPGAYTTDHIVPINLGGGDNVENLAPAHFACNRAKSDKLTGVVPPPDLTGGPVTVVTHDGGNPIPLAELEKVEADVAAGRRNNFHPGAKAAPGSAARMRANAFPMSREW